MYKIEIEEFILTKKDEMLADLRELISVDSSLSEATDNKPFGKGAAEVFAVSLMQLERLGFICKNYDNYVITADLNNNEKGLDILAHLDVVPAGDGWTKTNPFEMKIIGDRIYGRGTADDKGPAIAAMYAMRAIKELNIPLKKNVRLILGGCEECGGNELEYYYSKEDYAPATFSPDADFPLVNVERGTSNLYFSYNVTESIPSCGIISINSGFKKNVVPGFAKAEVSGLTKNMVIDILKDEAEKMNIILEIEDNNENVIIITKGEGCHSSTPECGRNALTAILRLLSMLPLKGELYDRIYALSSLYSYGVHHGENVGINLEDKKSGQITSSLNMLNTEDGIITGVVDSRIPICANKENYDAIITDAFCKAGFVVDSLTSKQPHYVSKDSELVKSLLDSYESVTGMREEPLIIGGGTYVHDIENGVAFGCSEAGTNNRMHASNEFMKVSVLIKSARIFADAIIRICG